VRIEARIRFGPDSWVRRFATKADAARWLRERVGPPGRDPHRLFSIVRD
jgi:hypothetical protein